MGFNTALSGLTAASGDLRVTGNNIANASTVGFKGSRAEFADVYASSLLGSGSNQIGSGVKLARVAQQFDQGNISFTNNSLDLAIDGNGFFVLSDGGARTFTRAGAFGVDDQGFIVSGSGARVQGFTANQTGTLSGILGDLQISTDSLPPLQTTLVEASVNLDARALVLSELGSSLTSSGIAVGSGQLGLPTSTPTTLETNGAPTPFDFGVNTQSNISAGAANVGFDFTGAAATSFEVQLSGSSVGSENTTATITLNTNIATLQDLIVDIRNDLGGTGIGLDVREDPNNIGRLQFYALNTGENSTITIDPNDDGSGYGTGVTQADIEAALGGIALGQGGGAGASNDNADPYGGTPTVGVVGTASTAAFDVTVSGSSGNNGTVTVNLDSNITDAASLVAGIQDDLLASGLSVEIRVDPADSSRVEFYSSVAGESSTISIGNLDASNNGVAQGDIVSVLNLTTGISVPGIAAASNGYSAQSVDVVYPDSSTRTVTIAEGASAAEIATQFSSTNVPDVNATASNTATIPASGYNNTSGSLSLSINGVPVSGTTLQGLADTINLGLPGLGTVTATIDTGGDLVISDAVGNDLVFSATGGAVDTLEIAGTQGANTTLDTSGSNVVSVGGTVEFTMGEGVVFANASPAVTNLFGVLDDSAFTEFALRTFEPSNQDTYNAATSLTIFDSLGNPHALSLYFVKERFTPGVAGEEENRWSIYAQIDGVDIGDPDLNLPPPQNQESTRSRFALQFNTDGTLNPAGTDPILISNWTPLDSQGNPNGATGPLNTLGGGALPIAQPPGSSNFEIRLTDSTQYGREFALGSIEQDGYTTGKLSGLAIDGEGIVAARFTNGQTSTLGQVALANFNNTQGLQAIGDTSWIETNQSGAAVVAAPASGSLGSIASGALEDSNVELSEQLVQLIIAQRNFQANSRTITTADEITQTIINI
ncbi:MAG: flagellar hook-basal body complex protein [Gammaproteobacteria bacterium]|nr:flagellar hook-basal body complex protein [Gammaproteobacteria bacterium]